MVVIMRQFHVQISVRTLLSQMALCLHLEGTDTSTARILHITLQMNASTGHIPVNIAVKWILMK